jgi:hypothetical protein
MKTNKNKKPNGIGGWLDLWVIGLSLQFIIILIVALVVLSTSSSDVYGLLIFLLVIAVLFLHGTYIVLFFRKKRIIRKITIIILEILFWGTIALTLISSVIVLIYPSESPESTLGSILGQSLIGILIQYLWLNYWKTSERVKNTFIK